MVRNNELVMFHDGVFELDVRVSAAEKTVWLTLDQIAFLFEKGQIDGLQAYKEHLF